MVGAVDAGWVVRRVQQSSQVEWWQDEQRQKARVHWRELTRVRVNSLHSVPSERLSARLIKRVTPLQTKVPLVVGRSLGDRR